MSTKEEQIQLLIDCGVVAIIRAEGSEELVTVFDSIRKGGVNIIEIAMTTPNAIEVIREVAQRYAEDVLIGVGTVLDSETARAAILAGAEFVVSPTLDEQVIRLCNRYRKAVVPGALSPTEILRAWELGADIVKVFPAAAVGPRYIKDIAGPLPHIPLLPPGGIDLNNAGEFIRAGAVALGVGGSLVSKKIIAEKRWDDLTETARKFADEVKKARAK